MHVGEDLIRKAHPHNNFSALVYNLLEDHT